MPYQDMRVGSKRPAFTFKEPAATPRPGGGSGINLGSLLGGLFGGRNKTVDYAQQDFERQKELMDKMYEMSSPYSTYGTTGSNVVDQDGKTITSSLSQSYKHNMMRY